MKKIALLITVALLFSAASLYAQTAKTRLDNGKQLFDQENYDGAIQELTEAIRLDPKLAEAYAYRSWAHGRNNNNDQALSDAETAIKLKPKLGIGYFVRGRLQNDYDRAIADYTQAIKLDSKFAMAYNNRGIAYANKKDYDRAIADYTQAIKLDSKFANAYNGRGVAYENKKDYDRAIADYTQAIKLDPKFAMAYNNRGIAYKAKKDYDSAIADYEAALKLVPNNSTYKSDLAEANKQKAAEMANNYDPSKFTVLPSGFTPADYTKVDLFKAVSDARNLQRASSKEEAVLGQIKSALMAGLGGNYYLEYVSDLTFVRQNGTDITFSSDDKAITQNMTIDQRSGLNAGQKVRVYYMVSKTPLLTWDVIAIERR